MTLKVSQVIVNCLENLGIEHVFGIPGIHNLDIYEQLIRSEIQHITARHEEGAGYMADGYARVSGDPTVCFVITGPGLTNISTAVAQAYSDSVPMIIISTQVPDRFRGKNKGFLHELNNSTNFMRSFVKESRQINRKEYVAIALREAYQLSISGRGGPVHLEIPIDILQSEFEYYPEPLHFTRYPVQEPWTCNPDKDSLEEAVNLIENSDSPVIIAGGGSANGRDLVIDLAERLQVPVLQTVSAKGIIPEDHPLCIGTRLHLPSAAEMLRESDLVIAIGSDLSLADFWDREIFFNNLIQINIDSSSYYEKCYRNVFLYGDVRCIVDSILSKLKSSHPWEYKEFNEKEARSRSLTQSVVSKTKAELEEVTGIKNNLNQLLELINVLRLELPSTGILVTDLTTPSYLAISEFPAYYTSTFLHPVNFGTLGYALPAAIGAYLSLGCKTVVLTGDGSIQFTMQELAVIADLQLPIVIVVWNDQGYGEIRRNQKARQFTSTIAVDHTPPSFEFLAQAYNLQFYNITEEQESEKIKGIIQWALSSNKPSLIEITPGGGVDA
ncbi:thiamine pyrophosphate-binding protein [Natranaerobius thermophilus]|uniref:Thiamine pyrophosphate protein TPP binding domain protein n=1 Tax=Natranaerobius thermophilus (strain ATCC BAA-1301 / DSM 18059 / JW/NM-WN-LF) TaxID=457570 RepID=B2A6H0_NATTJ|nr:thiamine pyrophosphate-binding protein [Natranaerobius thermophilus]ACB85503.1 thiamine pyrophosphate protein TPP binding domain protein [Natranaerobius thermophilus JW/NM-WN-LF]